MVSREKKSISIKKFKKKRELNLGIFLFAIVFIYLVVTVILYFTRGSISVYEVREGSIVRDNSYTGLIIRQETTVNAEESGYVSYFQNGNSKIKTGTNIYAISQEPLDTESVSDEEENSGRISEEVQSAIALQLQNFNENYDSNDFTSVYSLKNEISSALQNAYSETRMEHLGAVIAASSLDVNTYRSTQDGIIAFTVDGYESLTKDTFLAENFDNTAYESTTLADQMKISKGDPVYRLITSEDWSVILPLEKETAEQLIADEVSSVRVRIDKDSETMQADFSVIERDGQYYGCLDFDNSMIRYAEDRFLNVELILEDESGLKIPRSSVVEEKFYVIPEDYITTGGNSSSEGVMVRQDNDSVEFTSVDIYDSSDGEVCISRDNISEGALLVKPESNETYTVGKTKSLKGVYNINRGYAVFKKVSILCENDEYYIVQEGEAYGLSNYDHIVQNGSSVDPEEVVFQ
mgnify:FL=1